MRGTARGSRLRRVCRYVRSVARYRSTTGRSPRIPAERHHGVDAARMDRIHGDSVAAELERGGLRHPAHRELARHIRAAAGHAFHPGRRRHVDDRAAARILQRSQRRFHAEPAADLVHVDHLAIVVERTGFDRHELQDRRVVHEDVEPPEMRERCMHGGVPVVFVRHVEMLVARGVAEFGRDAMAGVVQHVGDHHACTFGDEPARLRLALAAARDQRHFAFESVHRVCSVKGDALGPAHAAADVSMRRTGSAPSHARASAMPCAIVARMPVPSFTSWRGARMLAAPSGADAARDE